MNGTPETANRVVAAVLEQLHGFHQPGSHDRRLLDGQVLLSHATQLHLYSDFTSASPINRAGTAPVLERAVAELLVGIRPGLASAAALMRVVSRLSSREDDREDRTEAEILAAGSATTLERARLFAVLAQVAGIAARVCLLYRQQEPAFHAVNELRVMDTWAVFDPAANQNYLVTHHPYASAWQIMRRPAIVDSHPEHGRKPSIESSFYGAIGIANIEL